MVTGRPILASCSRQDELTTQVQQKDSGGAGSLECIVVKVTTLQESIDSEAYRRSSCDSGMLFQSASAQTVRVSYLPEAHPRLAAGASGRSAPTERCGAAVETLVTATTSTRAGNVSSPRMQNCSEEDPDQQGEEKAVRGA